MKIRIQYDCANIDWNAVANTLRSVGMAHYSAEVHRTAFENSYTVAFVFDDDRMIGFGRAISDGAYQAAIYDVAVSPDDQGKGIGKLIIEDILNRLPTCNVILYASPGKEVFYEKLNFRKMKTGMARFIHAERMKNNGFTE